MTLPKIKHPIITLTLPSTGKKLQCRPFTIKEEKILLLKQTENNGVAILEAIQQIITNCILTKNIDVSKLASFDIEFLFLRLRAASVNNILSFKINDEDDGEEHEISIDLNKIEVSFPKEHTNVIKISDTMGLKLRYPNAEMMFSFTEEDIKLESAIFDLIAKCVDTIYDGEKIYVNGTDFDDSESASFIEELPPTALNEINNFFTTMPYVELKTEYKNKQGKIKPVEIKGFRNFFI